MRLNFNQVSIRPDPFFFKGKSDEIQSFLKLINIFLISNLWARYLILTFKALTRTWWFFKFGLVFQSQKSLPLSFAFLKFQMQRFQKQNLGLRYVQGELFSKTHVKLCYTWLKLKTFFKNFLTANLLPKTLPSR